jgi:hypothetical protein
VALWNSILQTRRRRLEILSGGELERTRKEREGEGVPHNTASKTKAVISTVQAATPPSTGLSSWITISSDVMLSVESTALSLVCVGVREGPEGVQVLSSNCSSEVWVIEVAIMRKSSSTEENETIRSSC